MFRYIALIWDERNPRDDESARAITSAARRASWVSQLEVPGYSVFVPQNSLKYIHTLPEGRGLLLGRIFKAQDSASENPTECAIRFSEHDASRLISGDGRSLIENYWGVYLAFLHDRDRRAKMILNSPASTQRCHLGSYRELHLCFARLEDVTAIIPISTDIDWDLLALQLRHGGQLSGHCSLKGISELFSGQLVHIASGTRTIKKTFLWNPCAVAKQNLITDATIAVRAVRNALRSCTLSWASCYSRVLVELSGGLDSSAVLGCLSDDLASTHIFCVNHFSPSFAESDERPYARLAAENARAPLIEIERATQLSLSGLTKAAATVDPYYTIVDYSLQDASRRAIQQTRAQSIFTGTLGDCLFLTGSTRLAVADCRSTQGWGSTLLRAAMDVALASRTSYWSALRDAWVYGDAKRYDQNFYRQILRQEFDPARSLASTDIEVANAEEYVLHPWYVAEDGVPPCKLIQISCLASLAIESPFANAIDPERIHPLASQPVVDLCLRIPTYLHLRGGWDRSIFRSALTKLVPQEILRRCTKGGVEDYLKAILVMNIGFIRTSLIDGVLASRGLLDRTKLIDVLSRRPTKANTYPTEILYCLAVELWARSIMDLSRRQTVASDAAL